MKAAAKGEEEEMTVELLGGRRRRGLWRGSEATEPERTRAGDRIEREGMRGTATGAEGQERKGATELSGVAEH